MSNLQPVSVSSSVVWAKGEQTASTLKRIFSQALKEERAMYARRVWHNPVEPHDKHCVLCRAFDVVEINHTEKTHVDQRKQLIQMVITGPLTNPERPRYKGRALLTNYHHYN